MGEGAFDLLKTGYSQPRRAKEAESGLAGLWIALSIRGLLVVELTLPVAGRLQPVPDPVKETRAYPRPCRSGELTSFEAAVSPQEATFGAVQQR
jgi:hypothetical protein